MRGRFAIHRIQAEEAKYKLCKVKAFELGAKKVPYIVTHDGRTIRYPDPAINKVRSRQAQMHMHCESGRRLECGARGMPVCRALLALSSRLTTICILLFG